MKYVPTSLGAIIVVAVPLTAFVWLLLGCVVGLAFVPVGFAMVFVWLLFLLRWLCVWLGVCFCLLGFVLDLAFVLGLALLFARHLFLFGWARLFYFCLAFLLHLQE